MAVNVIFSKMRFYVSNYYITFGISSVFMAVNFTAVKITGRVFYHFLPWDDIESLKVCVFLVSFATVLYVLTAFCVNLIPIPTTSKKEKISSPKKSKN